jgi:hypothetical protein
MKAEAALEVARRALLLGVAPDQRRVEIDRHPFGGDTQLPGVLAGLLSRRPQTLEQLGLGGDPLDRPVGGRVGGDLAKERRLPADRAQVAERLAAVGEHHRQVAHNTAGVVARAPLAHPRKRTRQRPRQPSPVGHLAKQRAARMRHKPLSVCRDFYGERAAITLHPQGDPPEPGSRASTTRRIPAQPDVSAPRPRPGRSPPCKIRARVRAPQLSPFLESSVP